VGEEAGVAAGLHPLQPPVGVIASSSSSSSKKVFGVLLSRSRPPGAVVARGKKNFLESAGDWGFASNVDGLTTTTTTTASAVATATHGSPVTTNATTDCHTFTVTVAANSADFPPPNYAPTSTDSTAATPIPTPANSIRANATITGHRCLYPCTRKFG
jgi:hypothetical protein